MATVKNRHAVMDSPTAPVFTDRSIFGQQTGLTQASTVVVTFPESMPSSYTVLVSPAGTSGGSWFISAKTTFGFTVNFATPSGTFDVLVVAA